MSSNNMASRLAQDGADGADGAQGIQGDPGADGAQGIQGDPGADGAQGIQGIQGDPGADGADGADGVDGVAIPSTAVLNGTADPVDNVDGQDDDFYINTTSDEIFGPRTSGVWGSGTSMIGTQGDPGADGADGADGAQGPQGDPGADGAQGPQGDPGADGTIYSEDPITRFFYIDDTGNDTNDATSGTPVLTMVRVLELIRSSELRSCDTATIYIPTVLTFTENMIISDIPCRLQLLGAGTHLSTFNSTTFAGFLDADPFINAANMVAGYTGGANLVVSFEIKFENISHVTCKDLAISSTVSNNRAVLQFTNIPNVDIRKTAIAHTVSRSFEASILLINSHAFNSVTDIYSVGAYEMFRIEGSTLSTGGSLFSAHDETVIDASDDSFVEGVQLNDVHYNTDVVANIVNSSATGMDMAFTSAIGNTGDLIYANGSRVILPTINGALLPSGTPSIEATTGGYIRFSSAIAGISFSPAYGVVGNNNSYIG